MVGRPDPASCVGWTPRARRDTRDGYRSAAADFGSAMGAFEIGDAPLRITESSG